ncbi:transcription factor AP-2 domain-containing protein [Ditylenchus destructor]|nr:transcription factor AP-2 domain-containing protein [Ditylenchus destructor]
MDQIHFPSAENVSITPSGTFQSGRQAASESEDEPDISSAQRFGATAYTTQSYALAPASGTYPPNLPASNFQTPQAQPYFGYSFNYADLYNSSYSESGTNNAQVFNTPQTPFTNIPYYSGDANRTNQMAANNFATSSEDPLQYSSSESSPQSGNSQAMSKEPPLKKPKLDPGIVARQITSQPTTIFFQQQRSTFETFCTVPGRTSLLSSTTKYKVTIGEIQRRISPPECLNASLLGGILRKAKSKDGGKALRESIGLALPAGRRKSASVTAWTALVEEEAVHMARDFHTMCDRDFPSKEMAQFLARNLRTEEDAQRRRAMLQYVRLFIKEISELMNSDRSPICGNRPEVILDPSIQKPLTHFSMVSHGFGGLAIVAVLDALNSFVHESFKHIDKVYGNTQNNFGGNFLGF